MRVPLSSSNDVASELSAKAAEVDSSVQAISSSQSAGVNGTGGGTPTGSTLSMLAGQSAVWDPTRAGYLLLLTDGLPNCNPNNSNTCADPATCKCTLSGGNCGSPGTSYCTLGCLDAAGTTAQVAQLFDGGVRTVVMGLGPETTSGDAPAVLNAMATAGGSSRRCSANSDCSAGATCDSTTQLCSVRYFQAANSAELTAALNGPVLSELKAGSRCHQLLLETVGDPSRLTATLSGASLGCAGAGGWTFSGNAVHFLGALCDQVKASSDPVVFYYRD